MHPEATRFDGADCRLWIASPTTLSRLELERTRSRAMPHVKLVTASRIDPHRSPNTRVIILGSAVVAVGRPSEKIPTLVGLTSWQ